MNDIPVVQHHYKVSKSDASVALIHALSSGLVTPLNGNADSDST